MHPTRSAHYKWAAAGMAFFAVLGAIGLARFSYSAILPSMQEGLGITAAQAGSPTSWNLAGYTMMALVGGMLASRFGPRIVVTGGLASGIVPAGSSFAMVLVGPTVPHLIAAGGSDGWRFA